jgi:hypothetical protein
MDDERSPDHTEDPREQGTGQGYPETSPAEATPAEGTRERPGDGGQGGPPAKEREEDRSQTTGNPDAAG